MTLTNDQRVLVHQIHPGKLAADIGTSLLSDALLWQHRLMAGLAVRYLGPALGSALVLRFANLDQLATSRAGQYVLKNMPTSMMAVRLAGDSLMGAGAWRRKRRLIAVGGLLIALGWSRGLAPSQAPDPPFDDPAG